MRPLFASECDDQGETSDDVILLKWRTMKTVFLLALASARRRPYIHALSVAPAGVCFWEETPSVNWWYLFCGNQGFLPRTSLPGIAHLNPYEAERMLCPVRQLKLYLRDSEQIWGGQQRLFIHWNRTIRDIMRSQISRWIVETVKEAYTRADRDSVDGHMGSEPCQPHGLTTVRWRYLTFCQLRFGGHQESSIIPICETWLVSLMGCLLWVQWWSHNRLADAVLCAGAAVHRSRNEIQFRLLWNFASDWLASQMYAATATLFHTWRYQLIIR